MFKHRWLLVLFVISCCALAVVYAAITAEAGQNHSLHFDVPTRLQKANVLVDFGHAVYFCNTPVALALTTAL